MSFIGSTLVSSGAFVLTLAFSGTLYAQSSITGTVTHVRDGDSIEVDDLPIRLNGLAAPNPNQPLGLDSAAFMQFLVFGKEITCELNGEMTRDQMVGVCYLDGEDIASLLVREGLAKDCPKYSGGRYAADQAAARETGISELYELPSYCGTPI